MDDMITREEFNEKIDELARMIVGGFSELRSEFKDDLQTLGNRLDARIDTLERNMDHRFDLVQQQLDGHATRIKDLEIKTAIL